MSLGMFGVFPGMLKSGTGMGGVAGSNNGGPGCSGAVRVVQDTA